MSININELERLIQKLRHEADSTFKKTGFIIGNTAKIIDNPQSFFTPVRIFPQIAVAGVVVYSEKDVADICQIIDSKVDYIFVDAEKKISKKNSHHDDIVNIERSARENIIKSVFFSYKGNDLTVESIDLLLSHLYKENQKGLGSVNTTIVGGGNLGSKLALKMVERGANVLLTRRNREKLIKIVEALNIIKPKGTQARVSCTTDNILASKNADILIGASSGSPAITLEMAKLVAKNAISLDAGKGSISQEAMEYFVQNKARVFRVDVTSSLAGMIESRLQLRDVFLSKLGRKKINGVGMVSGGLVGASGEVVVDNVNNPKIIYGVANGDGMFKKELSKIDIQALAIMENYIDGT